MIYTSFAEKISAALRDGAYLIIIEQYTCLDTPANTLSLLSDFLDGVPLPPDNDAIDTAMKGAGLNAASILRDTFLKGSLYRKGAAESRVCSGDVHSSFY